ncbi:hypothetical protein F4604DRAFT_1577364, partial [Suillus subluteus]
IHPEPLVDGPNSLLMRRDRFNAWMFLMDLCTHGPEYFRRFKSDIQDPETIERIPLLKTPIIATRAMDINNSTVSGNIHAVIELLAQGGIYDPNDMEFETPDISQHVVLTHGDLGTGEKLQTAQIRRSIESTPLDRLQHVIFIPGLFHLKMACADAIWRIFIQPLAVREDEMIHVKSKCPTHISLKEFAKSEPTLDDLLMMANELARNYVANHMLQRMRRRSEKERDLQFENALLMNKYFLLYEELLYAMNHRDIGRTETTTIAWIPILKATGKHKYATHMSNFLLNVHFIYPPGLWCEREIVTRLLETSATYPNRCECSIRPKRTADEATPY